MAFPFSSNGFWGPPKSRRLIRMLSQRVLARLLDRTGGRVRILRKRRERDRLVFDALEPRLLLNADIVSVDFAHSDPHALNHDLLVRLVNETATVQDQTVSVQRVQVLDQASNKVLAFGDLSEIAGVAIAGGAGQDNLHVDVASFGAATLPPIAFAGGGGTDSLVLDSGTAASWTLTGRDQGSVTAGGATIAFHDVANLTGAADSDDMLTVRQGGTLSGLYDGGARGDDALAFDASVTGVASYRPTGLDSGVLSVGGSSVRFTGLEPVYLAGGTSLTVDLGATVSGSAAQDGTGSATSSPPTNIDATLGYDVAQSRYVISPTSGSGFEKIYFNAPSTSLTINLGSGDDVLHVASLPPSTSIAVSGGDGNDSVLFDTAGTFTSDVAFTFDGGAGNDSLNVTRSLSSSAGIGLTFAGAAGLNTMSFGALGSVTAATGLTITATALDSSVVGPTGTSLNGDRSALIGVTIASGAVLQGATVTLDVGATTLADASGLTYAGTVQAASVASATISLAGSITATGAVQVATAVSNRVLVSSSTSTQLNDVRPTLTDTSTITVAGSATISGSDVSLKADTRAVVDVAATGLVLPGLQTFTDTGGHIAEAITAVAKGEADVSTVFDPLRLAFQGLFKDVNVVVTNTTAVSVDAAASLIQRGGTGKVDVAATDDTSATVSMISDSTGAGVAVLGAIAKDALGQPLPNPPLVGDLLNFAALSETLAVTRSTTVTITGAAALAAGATHKTIDADGDVTLTADSKGLVTGETGATKTTGGVTEAVATSAGSVKNTVSDTTTVTVSKVLIGAGSLAASATNATEIGAKAIATSNYVGGTTSATLSGANVAASAGGVSFVSSDRTVVTAVAVPTGVESSDEVDAEAPAPATPTGGQDGGTPAAAGEGDDPPSIGIARGSAINSVNRSVAAAITTSTVAATGGDIVASATNAMVLRAVADASAVAGKVAAAGSIAANVVLGTTTAALTDAVLTTIGSGGVTVEAVDDSIVDARTSVTVEGSGEKGATAIGGALAINIVGYQAAAGSPSDLAKTLAASSLDAILGTGLLGSRTVDAVSATVTRGSVGAVGGLSVAARSTGAVNATVSNAVKSGTPEVKTDDGEGDGGAEPAAAEKKAPVRSASSRSIGGLIANNVVSRSAKAAITDTPITVGGAVGVVATDATEINANVKLVASSVTTTDGGLDTGGDETPADFNASAGPVAIATGKTVKLDLVPTYESDTAGSRNLKTGDLVLVGEAHDQAKGEAGTLYRYTGVNATGVDLGAANYTGAGWAAVGEADAVYTYKGAAHTAASKLDLKTTLFTDTALWEAVTPVDAIASKFASTEGTKSLVLGDRIALDVTPKFFAEASTGAKALAANDLVLTGAGQDAAKGDPATYYKFIGTPGSVGAANAATFATEDFTVETRWTKLGEQDGVYAFMGADNASVNLGTADFTNLDLWRKIGANEPDPATAAATPPATSTAAKKSGSGATAAGGIVVRNEILGGATASISGGSVAAGSVLVQADRTATITAVTDATVEAIATVAEQNEAADAEATEANGGTATDAPPVENKAKPGQTSAFDKPGGSSALALNGVLATNTVLSNATASIANSSVTTTAVAGGADGSVSVLANAAGKIVAKTEAALTATAQGSSAAGTGTTPPATTSAKAGGIQLAVNLIGYERTNPAFATLDAVVGTNLGTPATAQASASITATPVNLTGAGVGAVTVKATNAAEIEAEIGNKVTASAEGASVSALAVSGVVALNKISGAAQATIDSGATLSATQGAVRGSSVEVSATDLAKISAATTIGASAKVTKTGGDAEEEGGEDGAAAEALARYTYTTASGARTLKFGDTVRVSDDWTATARGEAGTVYRYMGADATSATNLLNTNTALDFSDALLWKKLDESNVLPSEPGNSALTTGKLAKNSSTALGGIFARNDVSGRSQATVVDTNLTATAGNVLVSAASEASITAADESTVEAAAGFGGVFVTNTVLNGASASITGGTVTTTAATGPDADAGDVTVSAQNTASIDASSTGSIAGETTAVGVVLAFNSVGYQPQNILFNIVDTIVGDPLIATATNGETPADAIAFITGATVTAAGSVAVSAENSATISAVVGNEVSQKTAEDYQPTAGTGARGISAAALLATNKVSGRAEAYIGAASTASPGAAGAAASVTAGTGDIRIEARNSSAVTSESTVISSSAVDSVLVGLFRDAEKKAENDYAFTEKSGTQTVGIGDRVRIKGATAQDEDRIYVFLGTGTKAASAEVNLATGVATGVAGGYANTSRWALASEGAVTTTKPTVAGTRLGTTEVNTDPLKTVTTTVTATETFTTTKLKARYTTNSGYQYMRVGDTVKVQPGYDITKGDVGTIYIYRGADNKQIFPSQTNFFGVDWIPATVVAEEPQLLKVVAPPTVSTAANADGSTAPAQTTPTPAPTPPPSAKAFGGMIVMNDVRGGAVARATEATLTALGSVSVAASDKSSISANATSSVSSSAPSSTDQTENQTFPAGSTNTGATGQRNATLIAANGIAATNVVRDGGALATITRSVVTTTDGDVSVKADNEAGIDARLHASSVTTGGEGGGVSAAVTLAFNSVGYEPQNILFNTIDALIGSPTLANAFGSDSARSGATATIVASTVASGGSLAVEATSAAQINATVSNAALSTTDSLKGSGGQGFGVVLSSNKVRGAALASIDNTGLATTVQAGVDAVVRATDAVGIFANTQLVTSSTVTKTDGGAPTVQDKINKFLPSDFSTDPNEPQSATVLSNLVKNRNDLLPDQVKALGDKFNTAKEKILEVVERGKGLAADATAAFEDAKEKAETAVADILAKAVGAAVDQVVGTLTTSAGDLTKKAGLENIAAQLVAAVADGKSEGDLAGDLAEKLTELANKAIADVGALLADTTAFNTFTASIDTFKGGYTQLNERVAALRESATALQEEALAKVKEIKDKVDETLGTFGLSLADLGIDLGLDEDTGEASEPKTANVQEIAFGQRVRIAVDYATPTFKSTDTTKVTVATGDKIQTANGNIWKYVGTDDVLPATIDYTEILPNAINLAALDTNGKALWVKIASSASDYKANDIFVYMGLPADQRAPGAPGIDLAAQDYLNGTLWKRSLDSSFVPGDFQLPGTSAGPGTGTGSATSSDPNTAPVGDPSAGNPPVSANKQSASALAVGGIIVMNSAIGGATASVNNAPITASAGRVEVSAIETATITATTDSAATVKSASSYKRTSPLPAGGQTDTKSLALGGVIATNVVLANASATVTDSDLSGAAGLAVTAANTALIDATTKSATTSDGNAVALTLAFNTVGWREQNILFRTVDLIAGDPIAGALHLDDTPSGAVAKVTRSSLSTTTGDAVVSAVSDATITAHLTNKASSVNAVLKDASAFALGLALSSNLVNGIAQASIDETGATATKTVTIGGDLTVEATSTGTITSDNVLSALASLTKPSMLQDFGETILNDYTFTRASGVQTVGFGDTVYVKGATADLDKRYVYVGLTDRTNVDLATENLSGSDWQLNTLKDYFKYLPPGILNLGAENDTAGSTATTAPGTGTGSAAAAKPSATAVSAIIVRNDVRSTATAEIVAATVDATGDVKVAATQAATIDATIASKVVSKLKPGADTGTSVAVGGVIAQNAVLSGAEARIQGSAVTTHAGDAGAGDVSVLASNASRISANIDSIVESSGTAVGVVLAFNTIGVTPSNFLFQTADAIFGTDIAGAIGASPPATVKATITGSPIVAAGGITVAALSDSQITAEVTNAVSSVGRDVQSVGAVLALNSIKNDIQAYVSGSTSSLSAGGSIAITADSTSMVDAKVSAPVVAVAYNIPSTPPPSAPPAGSSDAISVGLSIARNAIYDVNLAAYADGLATIAAAAGNVSVHAANTATISADVSATAIAVGISTQGSSRTLGFAGGGALGFNTILGGVDAHVTNSFVSAGGTSAGQGAITIEAANRADIDAKITAAAASVVLGKSGATAVAIGVSLAFNMIGFNGAALSVANGVWSGSARSLDVKATATNTRLTAGRKVEVTADTAATIDATILAVSVAAGASSTASSSAVAGAGIYAGNKIVSTAAALIDGTTPAVGVAAQDDVTSGQDGVTVSARNASLIHATTVAASLTANLSGSGSSTSVAIGLSAANNDLSGDVSAEIRSVSLVKASGAVAVTAARTATIDAKTFAAAIGVGVSQSGSGATVSGGGALALNTITGSTVATIGGSAIGTGTGQNRVGSLSVTASDLSRIDALVGALALTVGVSASGTSAGVTVGLSVARNVIGDGDEVRAELSDTSVQAIGAASVAATSHAVIDATVATGSIGVSVGSTGVAVALAGVVALNDVNVATRALVTGDGSEGIRVGSLAVAATNASEITVIAGSASFGGAFGTSANGVSVSIALSVAVNTISGEVKAAITGATPGVTTTTGDLTVRALNDAEIHAISASASVSVGVGSTNGIAIGGGGAAAVNTIRVDTTALVSASTLSSARDLVVSANDTAAIDAIVVAASVAAAAGSSNGVGVAIGLSIAINEIGTWGAFDATAKTMTTPSATPVLSGVSATILNSSATATRDLQVTAASSSTIAATVIALSAALAGGGSNGVALSGAGVYSQNFIGRTTRAAVTGTGATTLAGKSVTVSASDLSGISANAGAAAVSGSVGGSNGVSVSIGLAIALNRIANDVSASVSGVSARTTGGNLTVTGQTGGSITTVAAAASIAIGVGGSAGIAVAGGGANAYNQITTSTHAFIATSTLASIVGAVSVTADQTSTISALIATVSAAVGAGGSAGVGVAVGVAAAENRIGEWTTTGDGESRVDTLVAGRGTAVEAYITGTTVTSASGALTVQATSASTIDAKVLAGSAAIGGGGSAGVGVAAGGSGVANMIAVATKAYIQGDGAGITAGSVSVSAADTSTIRAVAGAASLAAGGGGSAGVAVAVGFTLAINTIGNEVGAFINAANDRVRTTAGSISVTASNAAQITALAAAASLALAGGGAAGVSVSGGGALGRNTITTNTNAFVQDSVLDSADGVVVRATSTSQIKASIDAVAAAAGGGGAAGVGVAIGVALAENRIGRWTSAGAGDARVDTLGIGGETTIQAYLSNTAITAVNTVEVTATSNQRIEALVAAASVAIQGGGAAGVSVPVAGVTVGNAIGVATRAYISGDGAGITAGAVTLAANDTSVIRAFGGAASAGGAGGGAAGVAVAVGFALALNTISDTVAATILNADNLRTTKSGGVSVSASSAGSIDAVTAAASLAIAGGGAAGVSIAGGGAGAINVIRTNTTASIDASAIRSDVGGVSISASATTAITAKTDAAAAAAGGGGAAGVGVAVGIAGAANRIGQLGAQSQVQAFLRDTSVTAAGALLVSALSQNTIVGQVAAVSAAIQGGGAAAVSVAGAGAGVSNTIAVATQAFIQGDGTGITAGSVAVTAADRSTIQSLAGSAGVAVAGAGAASVSVAVALTFAYNTIGNTVAAYVRDANSGVTAMAGNVVISALNQSTIVANAAAASLTIGVAGAAGVAVSGGGAVAVNTITTGTNAFIDSTSGQAASRVSSALRDVSVTASSTASIEAKVLSASGAVGGGIAGVAVAVGLATAQNVIGNWTINTDQNGKQVGDPVRRSGASVGASIAGAVVNAGGTLTVRATSAETIRAETVAGSAVVAGGVAGIGVAGAGTYTGNIIAVATTAAITGGSANAGAVTVRAADTSRIDAVTATAAIAGSGGVVGVSVAIGSAVAVNTIQNDVNAGITGATVAAGSAALQSVLSGYETYWGYRNLQANPGVYDPTFVVPISQAERDSLSPLYRFQAQQAAPNASSSDLDAAVEQKFTTLSNQRTTAYRSLHTTYGPYGNSYAATLSGAATFGDVTVRADQDSRIHATAAAASVAVTGGAVGVAVSGGGAGATNVIGGSTRAGITNATVTAGPGISTADVTLLAYDTSTITADIVALSASAAFGGVAVGASLGGAVATNSIGYTTSGTRSAIPIDAAIVGSTVQAGGAIAVTATSLQTITATVGAGSVAIGVGAIGAAVSGAGAVSINKVAADVHAQIDGRNGGAITAASVSILAQDTSTLTVDTGAASVAAMAGLAGAAISIGVATATNTITNDVAATIANTSSLTTSGNVSVQASEIASLTSRAATAAVSAAASPYGLAVSGGGAGTNNVIGSTTGATVSASTIAAGGNVTVSANDRSTALADVASVSVAVGVLALAAGGAVSLVTLAPQVSATITGNSNVTATAGAVTVSATAQPSATSRAYGLNAGTAAVGVSTATATVRAAVSAGIGNARITAGSLSVVANLSRQGSADTANAGAIGAVGGLIGVNSTVTIAEDRSTVGASLATTARINLTGALSVAALGSTRQRSDASSAAIGLIAAGATYATSISDVDVQATIAATQQTIVAGSLSLTASNLENDATISTAGSGGLVAGSAAVTTNQMTGSTTASLADNVRVDLTAAAASGALTVLALHSATIQGQVVTAAYGALAGTGAFVTNSISSPVTVQFGASSNIQAKSLSAVASSTFTKADLSDPDLSGSTGGIASAAGAKTETTVDFRTKVLVGSNAVMNVVGGAGGTLTLAAQNALDAFDSTKLQTGGAISGAGASSSFTATHFDATVTVGGDARLSSTGAMTLSANGRANVKIQVEADTYGAATVAVASSTVAFDPINTVEVLAGGRLHAGGDLGLYAGTNKFLYDDRYVLEAYTDNFAGSAIPLSNLTAEANVNQHNNVLVAAQTNLESAGDANFYANRFGISTTIAQAKATNWTTAVAGAINDALGGGQQHVTGSGSATSHGLVRIDGEVHTGISRNIAITFDAIPVSSAQNPNPAPKGLYLDANGATVVTGTVNINGVSSTFTVKRGGTLNETGTTTLDGGLILSLGYEAISSGLFDALANANTQYLKYSAFVTKNGQQVQEDPDLAAFWQTQKTQITAELVASGLAQVLTSTRKDSNGNPYTYTQIVPTNVSVPTITVGAFTAAAGRIDVRADEFIGGGGAKLDAPGSNSVSVINNSPVALKIGGITVPETNGGVYLNGDVVSSGTTSAVNAAINAKNLTARRAGNEAASTWITQDPSSTGAAFGSITQSAGGNTGASAILIRNTQNVTPFNRVETSTVNGVTRTQTIAMTLPAPTITVVGKIDALNADLVTEAVGDINYFAEIFVKSNTTRSGASVTIKDVTVYAVGGEPYSQLKSVLAQYDNGLNAIGNSADGGTQQAAIINALNAVSSGLNTLGIEPTQQAAAIAQVPAGVNLYGTRISIDAAYVNVNGTIQKNGTAAMSVVM